MVGEKDHERGVDVRVRGMNGMDEPKPERVDCINESSGTAWSTSETWHGTTIRGA